MCDIKISARNFCIIKANKIIMNVKNSIIHSTHNNDVLKKKRFMLYLIAEKNNFLTCDSTQLPPTYKRDHHSGKPKFLSKTYIICKTLFDTNKIG